ncbi:MAG TPA: 2-amino-4-ketopentanoate thiolase [Thermoanaerobacterales bacterium]|nr:2-amino-4-ketopentanoate thiolase [Thermoanaerobacterales bacterium]
MKAQKNDWVEVEKPVLLLEQRSSHLPEDTKKVPLVMWVKGFLLDENASIGDTVKINTLTDRSVEGKLVQVNPKHEYDYGESIPELIQIGQELKQELYLILEREGS